MNDKDAGVYKVTYSPPRGGMFSSCLGLGEGNQVGKKGREEGNGKGRGRQGGKEGKGKRKGKGKGSEREENSLLPFPFFPIKLSINILNKSQFKIKMRFLKNI